MERSVFENAVSDIFLYYDYRLPDQRRMDRVFQKVENIPGAAVDFIVKGITDDKDTPPRNIGKAFIEYYNMWGQVSDRKTKKAYEPVYCDDCGGEGLLHFKAADQVTGKFYKKVAICGKCDNWKIYGNKFAPAIFKSELIRLGLKVDPPAKYEKSVVKRFLPNGILKKVGF